MKHDHVDARQAGPAQRHPVAALPHSLAEAPEPTDGAAAMQLQGTPRMASQRQQIAAAFGASPMPAAQLAAVQPSVVQRNGDKWALKSTTDARQAIDETPVGKTFEFRFDHGEKAGFGTTLHHHISRAKMSEIVLSFKASQRKQSKMKKGGDKDEYAMALGEFDKAVTDIANEAELDTDDIETRLHNVPLNLHYGPSIVKDNPGAGFDPSTRPKAGTDGERELEPTSAALLAFLTTYQGAVDALPSDSDGGLDGDVWVALAEQFRAAHALYRAAPNLVAGIAVNSEQWVTTEGSDTWAKRGGNKWPALETARQRFAERVGPLPAGGAALSAHHDFQILDDGEAPVTIRIGYSGNALTHFCNRHTYRHFDNGEIKLLNTFFPRGTNQAAVVLQAQAAFALIEAELRSHLTDGAPSHEITGRLIELLAEDDGLSFTSAGLLMTVIDRDDLWDADVDGAVDLVQVSPTGTTYESYDAKLLQSLNLV